MKLYQKSNQMPKTHDSDMYLNNKVIECLKELQNCCTPADKAALNRIMVGLQGPEIIFENTDYGKQVIGGLFERILADVPGIATQKPTLEIMDIFQDQANLSEGLESEESYKPKTGP